MPAPTPPCTRPITLDCCFDHGTGWQMIPTAEAFVGDDLRYRLKPGDTGGAEIDPITGVLLVPTGQPHSGHLLQVQATNGGGMAEIRVQVTVEDDSARAAIRWTQNLPIDGVIFHFDAPVAVGHFISGAVGQGDPFVIGPVILTGYSPGPARINGNRTINGAMLNPRCTRKTGFDSMAGDDSYDSELNAGLRLPLRLQPGDRIIVGISNIAAENGREIADRFIVLTCLDEPPFADAFRPPYSGTEQPIWRLSDLRTDRLPILIPTGRIQGDAEQSEYERRVARFAVDIVPNWNRDNMSTPLHPPLYGRELCNADAALYLWVGTDRPLEDKAEILIGLVQRGIDRYGVFRDALAQGFHPWRADGAHHSGRKFSILFAGHLLADPGMLSIVEQGDAVEGRFHEDEMTFYVTPEIVELSNSPNWRPPYANDDNRPKQPYIDAMVGMPDWRGNLDPARVNAAWTGHPYRISGNHNTQHAQVLMCLAMGLRGAWRNDAYFDYHMRFCEIIAERPDPWRFRGGNQALYDPVVGSTPPSGWANWQRFWQSEWAWQMLMAYRNDVYRYPWL